MNSNLYEVSFSNTNIGVNKIIFSTLTVFKFILYVMAFLTFVLAFFVNNWFWLVFAVVIILYVLTIYFLGVANRSYDYLFVDNYLRFNKVLRGIKRYKIEEFAVKDIQKIYLVGSANYNKKAKEKAVNIINATKHLSGGLDIAINYIKDKNEKLIIIKYDRTFLTYLLRSISNKKLDEEFVKKLSEENE